MIVTLDQRLFEPGLLPLKFVFAANERSHVLLTDPEWDASDASQPVQIWLNGQPKDIRDAGEKELERGLDEAANMGASVARIRVEPIVASRWEDGKLSPDDALRLMQTPLWLMLENGRSDLEFVRRILEVNDRAALNEHLAAGRVEVPPSGGTGGLKLFLESLATLPAKPLLSGDIANWIRRLRTWVMFDRDAHPNDPRRPSKTSEDLREICAIMTRPRPFPGHQLGRRTIENYLPFEALDHWAGGGDGAERQERRRRVDAFKSSDFGGLRRVCFAMKDGFIKDVAQSIRDEFKQRGFRQRKIKGAWTSSALKRPRTRERWLEESELPAVFQGMAHSTHRHHLRRGFGTKIAELFADKALNDIYFQSVFDADPVAAAWRRGLVESLWAVL